MNATGRIEKALVREFDPNTDRGKVTWGAFLVMSLYLAVALQPNWPVTRVMASPLIAADEFGHVLGCIMVGYDVDKVLILPNGTLSGRTDFMDRRGRTYMEDHPGKNAVVYIMGPLFTIALGSAFFYCSALITEDKRIWSRNIWEYGFLAIPGLFLLYGRVAMLMFEPGNPASDLAQFQHWTGFPAFLAVIMAFAWVAFVKWWTMKTDEELSKGRSR